MRRHVRLSPFACAFTHSPSHGASMTRGKRKVEEEIVQEEEAADRRGRRCNKAMVEALARGRAADWLCARARRRSISRRKRPSAIASPPRRPVEGDDSGRDDGGGAGGLVRLMRASASFHAHRHSQGTQAISTLRFTNRPMMKVRLGPTADRATSRWPSLTGQARPTASGQEKQG